MNWLNKLFSRPTMTPLAQAKATRHDDTGQRNVAHQPSPEERKATAMKTFGRYEEVVILYYADEINRDTAFEILRPKFNANSSHIEKRNSASVGYHYWIVCDRLRYTRGMEEELHNARCESRHGETIVYELVEEASRLCVDPQRSAPPAPSAPPSPEPPQNKLWLSPQHGAQILYFRSAQDRAAAYRLILSRFISRFAHIERRDSTKPAYYTHWIVCDGRAYDTEIQSALEVAGCPCPESQLVTYARVLSDSHSCQ